MKTVDINCDLGESYGRFKVGKDQEIMPFITSCNIACGFHGGDPLTIQKTIRLALRYGVQIGAHPSYPDLVGFGRRSMNIPQHELEALLIYQISAMKGMVESEGGTLAHVKPHGALYNDMSNDPELINTVIRAIKIIDPNLYLVGPSMLPWVEEAYRQELRYVEEVFSDRNYQDNLLLVSRAKPSALIENLDDRIKHIVRMVLNDEVLTESGKVNEIRVGTICIHGDHHLASSTAEILRHTLQNLNCQVAAYATTS